VPSAYCQSGTPSTFIVSSSGRSDDDFSSKFYCRPYLKCSAVVRFRARRPYQPDQSDHQAKRSPVSTHPIWSDQRLSRPRGRWLHALVDTTLGGAAEGLITAATEAGGQIKRIALTHGHLDHVGSLDALKDRLGSNVEISMGELDARILAGEKVVEGKLPGSWPKVKTAPDNRLTGGETIGSLEVVPTPGHSPGHVAFRDTRDGTVIAGDVVTSFGASPFPTTSTFASRSRPWRPGTGPRTSSQLEPSEPSTLLVVGHGPATRLPAAAIDAAISRAQR
jgi:glyoxylase-like metal-dependent hydrolase (beta-lactamase superfamily II)